VDVQVLDVQIIPVLLPQVSFQTQTYEVFKTS